MSDKPSFLKGVDETPEEKEIMDVLRDEPTNTEPDKNDETSETPSDNNSPGVSDSPSPSDDTTETPAKGDDSPSDSDTPPNPTPSDNDDSTDSPSDSPKVPDNSKEEEDPSETAKKQIDLKFGTFKSAEDAEKAFKEMQRTLTKLTSGKREQKELSKEEADNFTKMVKLAQTQQLVDVKLPKAESYRLSDGSFDLDGYGRDLVQKTVMGIQQALIGGQLGSLQFGILQQAMNEEFQSGMRASQVEEASSKLEQQIFTEYPIFKTNEKASELLEQAIYGEASRREALAKKAGKEPEPMVEQDFLDIAKKLVENFNIPITKQEEEPADKIHPSPSLQPDGARKLTGIDKDIEDMKNIGNKTGSIF